MVIEQRIDIKPLSVNAAWQGRRFKTKAYKDFEKEMLFKLRKNEVKHDSLVIDLEFGMSNKRMDIDNPIKMTLDILCKKFGFDDSQIQSLSIKKRIVKKGQEYIWFRLNEQELTTKTP